MSTGWSPRRIPGTASTARFLAKSCSSCAGKRAWSATCNTGKRTARNPRLAGSSSLKNCSWRSDHGNGCARTRPTGRGDCDRCEFRDLLPAIGCIDQCELADFRRRTLPAFSERFWAKCAASCRICGGVATASSKATLPAAGCLSNFCNVSSQRNCHRCAAPRQESECPFPSAGVNRVNAAAAEGLFKLCTARSRRLQRNSARFSH